MGTTNQIEREDEKMEIKIPRDKNSPKEWYMEQKSKNKPGLYPPFKYILSSKLFESSKSTSTFSIYRFKKLRREILSCKHVTVQFQKTLSSFPILGWGFFNNSSWINYTLIARSTSDNMHSNFFLVKSEEL